MPRHRSSVHSSSLFDSLGKAALGAVILILLVRTIRRRDGMTTIASSSGSPMSVAKPTLLSNPFAFLNTLFETPSFSVSNRKGDPQCVPTRSLAYGSGLFPFFSRVLG